MLSRIHNKLGTAGLVVAIVALVAALGGAAWAASDNHLSGGEKKEVKKIAKSFQGQGPVGPQGPAGAPGKAGAAGAAGAKGATGARGATGAKGATGTTGATGESGTAGATGATGTFGSEPLPSGQTLKGIFGSGGEGFNRVPVSFPVRVSPAPTAVIAFELFPGFVLGKKLKENEIETFGPHPNPESEEEAIEDKEAYENACPGSFSEPKAGEPAVLCIYEEEVGSVTNAINNQAQSEAAHEFGVTLFYGINEETAFVRGSWAVTAE